MRHTKREDSSFPTTSWKRWVSYSLPHVFFAGALEMIATVAPWFLTMVLTILVVFLFVLPLLDRSEERHPMKRKIFVLIILAVIVMWIAFTVLGF
jgi:quinol-cytochrome oxidoreductase complex cytochrome b subunit